MEWAIKWYSWYCVCCRLAASYLITDIAVTTNKHIRNTPMSHSAIKTFMFLAKAIISLSWGFTSLAARNSEFDVVILHMLANVQKIYEEKKLLRPVSLSLSDSLVLLETHVWYFISYLCLVLFSNRKESSKIMAFLSTDRKQLGAP